MENKETNFEVNLLPVISLLAVCISFLLLTAVWLPIGTMDIKQSVGESSDNGSDPSRFEISVKSNDLYELSVQKDGKKIDQIKVSDSTEDNKVIHSVLQKMKEKYPDIAMVFVSPERSTKYQKVVGLLETLKKLEIKEIGVSPVL